MATVEPTIYPPSGSVAWLSQAVELEGLAKVAQAGVWTAEQANEATDLVAEIAGMMLPAPPVVEPPPVEPPVTVPPEPIKPPPSSGDKYPKGPPASTARVLKVPEDYQSVQAALEVAKPGETVSVADGFKCGELTLSKGYDPSKPVVLRARNQGKAELDKRVRIRGQGYWLHGLKSTFKSTDNAPGAGAIVLEADYVSFTKMEVQSPHGITAPGNNRRGINIGWCLFNGQNAGGGGVSNIYFNLPGGGNGTRASDLPRNVHIYRCDFDDTSRSSAGSHEDHVIYFGPSKARGNDLLTMEDVEIYQCLIRNTNIRVRGFYMKRGCRMIQNSLLGKGYNWGIRHGGDSVIEGNTATGSYRLIINGAGTRILGNTFKQAILYAGSSPEPLRQAADRAFLDSNTGPVSIGYVAKTLSAAEGGKVGGVLICNHTGQVSINDAGTERDGVKQQKLSQGTYLPRLPLTPADVGLAG